MKKALLIFLTLAMLLSLCACRENPVPNDPDQNDSDPNADAEAEKVVYTAAAVEELLADLETFLYGHPENSSEKKWSVMTDMNFSDIQEILAFDLIGEGFKLLSLEVNQYGFQYYYVPFGTDKFDYDTGCVIAVSREEDSFAAAMAQFQLTPDGRVAYDSSRNTWFVDHNGEWIYMALPEGVTMDRAQVADVYLSRQEYRVKGKEVYPLYRGDFLSQYVFAEDFVCIRNKWTDDLPEAMFPMLAEDVQALRSILDTARWQEGTWKFGATYVLSWADLEVWLVCEPDLEQEPGDPCWVMDLENDRSFEVSEKQWNVMKEILAKYPLLSDPKIDTLEYVFEEDFECTRKTTNGGETELTFPMLNKDVQNMCAIILSGTEGNDCMKTVPDYVFTWRNIKIYYTLTSYHVNVDSGVAGQRHYTISAEQQKWINDILAKYPLDLLDGQEGVISYGSAQCELPSAGIDLLCGVVNGAVWTLGEPKAVCSYKITLDGRELEYSPEGILCDSANGRYTLVSLNQKNKINALIELLIGTIDTTLPPT